MILTCPDCGTRYSVEAGSLGETGRTVRCNNCGTRWTARPPDDAPRAVPPEAADQESAPGRAGGRTGSSRGSGTAGIAIGLALMLVLLIGIATVVARDEVVARFPASAELFQRIGLAVTVPLELDFQNVTSSRVSERGISILTVEGEIVNLASQAREVPPIRITLLDGAGRQLRHELVQPENAELEPGGRMPFTGRLVNPADQALNFRVTFALQ